MDRTRNTSSAKHLAVIMAPGVAFVLIGLISGTSYWILSVVLSIIGLVAHFTSPAPAASRVSAEVVPKTDEV